MKTPVLQLFWGAVDTRILVDAPHLGSGAGRWSLNHGVLAGRFASPADVAGLAEEVVVQGIAPVLCQLW